MAAHRVTLRLLKVGTGVLVASGPLVSYKVYAADEAEGEGEARRGIRITELPIYDNPEERSCFRYVEEEITPFRQTVSSARQRIWSYLETIQDTTDYIKEKYEIGKAHTQDFIDYIQNDPGILPRATVITIAGLGGIVAGHRGGTARRVFYSLSAMVAAASFCYPNEAVELTESVYNWTLEKVSNVTKVKEPSEYPTKSVEAQDFLSEKEKPPTVSTHPDKVAAREAGLDDTCTVPQFDAKKLLEGDPGMSKEEDKDMYTTRGS